MPNLTTPQITPSIYGLITDKPIRDYCKTRKISSFPFYTSKSEIRTPEVPHCKAIESERLYELVKAANPPLPQENILPVILYGSSKFHYITHGLMKHVDRHLEPAPYTFFLIDNHNDSCRIITRDTSSDPTYYINCANHAAYSVQHRKLGCNCGQLLFLSRTNESILLTSHINNQSSLSDMNLTDIAMRHLAYRPLLNPEEFEEMRSSQSGRISGISHFFGLMDLFCLPSVYLSIDIDVLDKNFVDINTYENYRQGHLHLDDLVEVVGHLLRNKNVAQIDICGMTPDPKSWGVYDRLLDTLRSI